MLEVEVEIVEVERWRGGDVKLGVVVEMWRCGG